MPAFMEERDSEPGRSPSDRGHGSDAIRQDARGRGTRTEIKMLPWTMG